MIMKAIREALMKRRRAFSYQCNGQELLPIRLGAGTVDAANGPIPLSCNIIYLTNTTYIIDYHIRASYWENNFASSTTVPPIRRFDGNQVLYNRWTETVDIDNCNQSTITRTGKYIIRSDNVSAAVVDTFRYTMAVLGIRRGFTRQSSQYVVSTDGLGLAYTVVDKEQFKMPPPPAFEAEGSYREIVEKSLTGKRHGIATVRLKGDRQTPQADLISAAIAIGTRKLYLRGEQVIGGARGVFVGAAGGAAGVIAAAQAAVAHRFGFQLIEMADLTIDMYQNVVSFTIQAMMGPPFKTTYAGLVAFMGATTFTPLSDDVTYTPNYLSRGTAGILLQAAAYYDPSIRGVQINQATNQLNRGLEVGQAGNIKE